MGPPPANLSTRHVALLTGVHLDSCGLPPGVRATRTTYAPHVPRVGHARPYHVASVPRRIRVGSARHVSSAGSVENKPPFSNFN